MRRPALASLLLAVLLAPLRLAAAGRLAARPGAHAGARRAAAAEPSPLAALKEPVAFRPIEANVIINLPSVEVPSAGTLTLARHAPVLRQPSRTATSTTSSRSTPATRGASASGTRRIKNLNARLLPDLGPQRPTRRRRSTSCPTICGFALVAARRRRLAHGAGRRGSPKSSFFAQAHPRVLLRQVRPDHRRADLSPADERRLRPTSTAPRSGRPVLHGSIGHPPPDQLFDCSGLYENVFNVPVAASIAITHSITIHGEVIPRLSKVNSRGVGWSVERREVAPAAPLRVLRRQPAADDRGPVHPGRVPFSRATRTTSTSASTSTGPGSFK